MHKEYTDIFCRNFKTAPKLVQNQFQTTSISLQDATKLVTSSSLAEGQFKDKQRQFKNHSKTSWMGSKLLKAQFNMVQDYFKAALSLGLF